jgi:hypothetical protein
MTEKPKAQNSEAAKQMDRVDQQMKAFDENIKELTLDRMNEAPMKEMETQSKLSQSEKLNSKDIYLKPEKSIGCQEKFNEKYRKEYEFGKEMVHFECENHEIIGEQIEIWTRPYPGVPAQFWKVPVNKPVWGPRFLAEQISRKFYHRFITDESRPTEQNQAGVMTGAMIVDKKIPRISARPVSTRKSIFLGNF